MLRRRVYYKHLHMISNCSKRRFSFLQVTRFRLKCHRLKSKLLDFTSLSRRALGVCKKRGVWLKDTPAAL